MADPKPDIVVQVVVLAEDESIQEKLAYYDLQVQTFEQVAPVQVYPARVLNHIVSHLGIKGNIDIRYKIFWGNMDQNLACLKKYFECE